MGRALLSILKAHAQQCRYVIEHMTKYFYIPLRPPRLQTQSLERIEVELTRKERVINDHLSAVEHVARLDMRLLGIYFYGLHDQKQQLLIRLYEQYRHNAHTIYAACVLHSDLSGAFPVFSQPPAVFVLIGGRLARFPPIRPATRNYNYNY